MKYKILQVIDKLEIGGAEKIAVLCANILKKRGLEVGLISLINEGILNSELNKNIKYYNLLRKSKWNLFSAIKFNKIASNYDILHVHMHHNLYWVLFWEIILRKKYNIIFHNHNNKKFKWKVLLKLSKSKISHVIVNKEFYSNQLLNNNFYKLYYLENIISRYSLERKYLMDSSSLKIVLVSNLRQLKNIEFALQIANYLAKKKSVVFDIYYSNYNQNYVDSLNKYLNIKEAKLDVNFIKDDKNPSLKFYKYDFALHTSIKESGPLTLLEYISAGLPFLSFNTGQSIELIRNIYPEFIAKRFILEEWMNNINKILSLGRDYYSKKLKALYCNHYSNEKYFNKCRKIYLENLN